MWRPARRAEVRTIQFAGDGVAMRDEWQQAARARREEQREAAVQALAPRENGSSADVLRVRLCRKMPYICPILREAINLPIYCQYLESQEPILSNLQRDALQASKILRYRVPKS